MKLDRIHKHILQLLQKDARMSATAIAEVVGLSRPAVQERILAMEAGGILQGYHAKINETAALVRAVLFVQIAERPCDTALQWLAGLKGVNTVQSVAGRIDAVVSVSVPDAESLSNLCDKMRSSDLITSVQTSVVLRSYDGPSSV